VLSVTIGNCFPLVWEILLSAFGVEQYFPNIGETISNSDLSTSHCLYNMSVCIVQRVLFQTVNVALMMPTNVRSVKVNTISLHRLRATVRYFCSFTLYFSRFVITSNTFRLIVNVAVVFVFFLYFSIFLPVLAFNVHYSVLETSAYLWQISTSIGLQHVKG